MTLSIALNEDDIRSMPSQLRDSLLKWYFDAARPRAFATAPAPAAAVDHDESRRVTFAKLVSGGLLKIGEEISCRALKRQQRAGKPQFIEGARVSPRGKVEYDGKSFSNPSTLAVEMVRKSGGKPTALNGFDYLFVHTDTGLVPLKKLRDRLTGQGEDELRASAEGAVHDAKKYYGRETEISDHLPHLRKLRRQ